GGRGFPRLRLGMVALRPRGLGGVPDPQRSLRADPRARDGRPGSGTAARGHGCRRRPGSGAARSMTHVREGVGAGDATGGVAAAAELRPLRTHEDFAACVELQRLTWGGDYTDIVPASLLKVVPKVGGVVAGPF